MADIKKMLVNKLIDLRRSKKQAKRAEAVESSSEDTYPYGSRLSFDEEEVKKLGIADLKPGETVRVIGVGSVKRVSINEEDNGKKRHDISIQIEKLVIGPVSKKGK